MWLRRRLGIRCPPAIVIQIRPDSGEIPVIAQRDERAADRRVDQAAGPACRSERHADCFRESVSHPVGSAGRPVDA